MILNGSPTNIKAGCTLSWDKRTHALTAFDQNGTLLKWYGDCEQMPTTWVTRPHFVHAANIIAYTHNLGGDTISDSDEKVVFKFTNKNRL